MTLDPLTANLYKLLSENGWRNCSCDPRAYHAEECWVTPIYAALVEEIDSVWGMLRDLQMADLFTHEQVKQWWNRLGSNEDPS